jgi:hypothetical protein
MRFIKPPAAIFAAALVTLPPALSLDKRKGQLAVRSALQSGPL